MLNGHLFIYNHKNLKNYDISIVDNLKEVDYYKVLKSYFGKLDERGNHKNFIRKDCKIYFYWNKQQKSYIEIQYAGIKAVNELMTIAKTQNWSIMYPNNNDLINLNFIDEAGYKSLEVFLTDEEKFE